MMVIMLPRLIVVLPGSTFPSVMICRNMVKIAPKNEVMEHKVKGAGKWTIVTACNECDRLSFCLYEQIMLKETKYKNLQLMIHFAIINITIIWYKIASI